MASKNTQVKQQMEAEKDKRERKAFLEEYQALIEPLNDKHGMRLVPIVINNSSEAGIRFDAGFAVQRFTKEVIEVKKANENGDKSKADGRADTDNQAS